MKFAKRSTEHSIRNCFLRENMGRVDSEGHYRNFLQAVRKHKSFQTV